MLGIKMKYPHFYTLLFTLLVNLLYCICQEHRLNDWVNSNNCLPNAPVNLDLCICQCSDVTAALRSSPDLQLEVSRRLQNRRRNGKDSYTIKPYTPGVIKCWETCADTLL
ncbi:uncharacterized protein LOC134670560 [Cydia fagiglandana]|uniref:uncharacterized protein LOC134670560 n=1 Tax=Cydia fagiglandana TaxID=1458189 RepID=UPI002FEE0E6D